MVALLTCPYALLVNSFGGIATVGVGIAALSRAHVCHVVGEVNGEKGKNYAAADIIHGAGFRAPQSFIHRLSLCY